MAKKQKSSEKELKGFLLSRFFFVLAIVSVVELIAVGLTNAYLIPALVTITHYDKIIKIDGAEGLFMIVFVLVATWLVNRIFPALNASPAAVNDFLEKLLIRRGFVGGTDQEVTETIHALNRGENITIIFINNAIYGMTGGQMAPTTLVGQKTSTCPYGRDPELHGYPLKMPEIAAQLEGTCYVTRQSVETVGAINKAKKAIRKAFEANMAGKGSCLVEITSTCSSGWKMSPIKANKWLEDHMMQVYTKGDLKDTTKQE